MTVTKKNGMPLRLTECDEAELSAARHLVSQAQRLGALSSPTDRRRTLARIRHTLRSRMTSRVRVYRLAAGVALLIATAGAVGAATYLTIAARARPQLSTLAHVGETKEHLGRSESRDAQIEERAKMPEVARTEGAPDSIRPTVSKRQIRMRSRILSASMNEPQAAPLDQTPSPKEDFVTAEAGAIANAIRELRLNKDPRAALAELDAYETKFPLGTLHLEGSLLRIEALKGMGEFAKALDRVDLLLAAKVENVTTLSRIKGDLLLESGNFSQAATAFSYVLTSSSRLEIDLEAAAWGLVICFDRLKQQTQTLEALRRYKTLLPNGKHIKEVAAALENSR